MPGRRGKPVGVSIIFDMRCRCRFSAAGIGLDVQRFRRPRARVAAAARAPRRLGVGVARPAPADERPADDSAAAPRTRRPPRDGPSARAVTTSNEREPLAARPRRVRGRRERSPPRTRRSRARGRRIFRAALSTSATLVCGRAIASGRPGTPAPDAQIGESARAARTGSSSSATSESARWSSITLIGSRTAVGASGSSASRREAPQEPRGRTRPVSP